MEEQLTLKIELLQEQIENIEQSGFFTEKDMDRFTGPIRLELKELKDSLHQIEAVTLSK